MQQNTPSSNVRPKSRPALVLPGILLLLLSIALIAFAVYSNNLSHTLSQTTVTPVPAGTPDDPNPNAPVTCNGEPMSPGQICDHIETINGLSSTTKYSYEEQQQYQRRMRIAQLADKREQESITQKMKQKSSFSLFGCLSAASCLTGLVLAGVALQFFRRKSRQRAQSSQPAPNA